MRFNSISFVNVRPAGLLAAVVQSIARSMADASGKLQNSGVTADLFDVKFLDASEGWAVGAEGMVLHTSDGGLRWTRERSGTPHALERIFFTDRSHGWAVGFGGTIIAYGGSATAP